MLISRVFFSSDEQLTSLCDVLGSTNSEHIQHNRRSQTIKIVGEENDVCVCVCLWTSMAQLERFAARNVKFFLSLALALSPSVSRANLCYALLTCQSCFFHQHWHSWRKREKTKEKRRRRRRRKRRCVFLCESSNETIVVLHTKLSCCFYWCYSLVTMRDVTPRQLCQCARLYTYMRNDVYTWTSISHTF